MALPLTKTTELEAVNFMLATIGESPVETLEEPLPPDAALAIVLLGDALREVQSTGWHFNTEDNVELTPDGDKFIIVNDSVLRIDGEEWATGRNDIVLRGNKLYDRIDNTSEFEAPIRVEITRLLPFEECPEVLRHYVKVKASRSFQDKVQGSESIHTYSKQDEFDAKARLETEEGDQSDYNYLDDVCSRRHRFRSP